MWGFDHQMQFAAALTGRVVEASSQNIGTYGSMFGRTERDEPGRSWYRSPTPNLFDWTAWGVPASAAQPWTPWAMAIGQPIGAPMFGVVPFAQQPWSALASFASTMAAMQSYQNAWMPPSSARPAMPMPADVVSTAWQAMMWPLTQFAAIAAPTPAHNPYSSYRSDGGHAVAQIVAEPELAAPTENLLSYGVVSASPVH